MAKDIESPVAVASSSSSGAATVVNAVAAIQKAVAVSSARSKAAEYQRLALIGPAKHGKTSTALTISKYAPDTWPAKELTELSDVLLVMIDVGGHDTVLSLNVDVPMIDLSLCQESNTLSQAFKQAMPLIRQRVAEGTTKAVILDSFSEYTERYLRTLMAMNPGVGQKEFNEKIWTPLAVAMGGVFGDLASLPCDVIIISHVKDKGEDKEGKRFAATLPGGSRVEMDVVGKSAAILRRNCSNIIPVVKTQAGKNTPPEFALYPNGGYLGMEGGTRYKLNDKEEPHLGKLFAKIRAQKAIMPAQQA